jgi:hypothetical protein
MISAFEVKNTPPTTSLCPLKYFVLEWTTASAPSASGSWKYGVANVLSTTNQAPAWCAIWAAAAMSVMCISGFVGVSTRIIRVDSRISASMHFRSRVSTKVNSSPRRPST